MYKARLQETCQKRLWAVPQYTSSREGPDHNPLFRASVTVNGFSFDALEPSKSSKEAQNKAAQAALEHLDAPLPTPAVPARPPAQSPSESQISYKSQLQNFVQRTNAVAKYSCVREGPPHALLFKATVTVDGQIFESPQFCNTQREAEHAAAKVALMALPQEENHQEETGFFKNLLQELAQKEGFSLPVYKTVGDGASHMPIFSSTVEIEGESFEGDISRSKKQAEMNAAKVAWCKLKERKSGRVAAGLSPSRPVQKDLGPASIQSQFAAINLKQPRDTSVKASWVKIDFKYEEFSDKDLKEDLLPGIGHKNDLSAADATANVEDDKETHSSGETVGSDSSHIDESSTSPPKLLPEVMAKQEDTVDCTSTEWVDVEISSTSVPSASSHAAEANTEFPLGEDTDSFLCNRVRIYPRKSGIVLPEGATLLPFSDDKWVAVSLDFSNHEGGVLV